MRLRSRAGALLVAAAMSTPLLGLATTTPAQATTNFCHDTYGYGAWTSDQDVVDAYGGYCRRTFVDDAGVGHRLSRRDLLDAASFYNRLGFDRQWLWYAHDTSLYVPGNSSLQWGGCVPAGGLDSYPAGPCPYQIDSHAVSHTFDGNAVTLQVFSYDGRFIANACGNPSMGISGSDPVPTISGYKFDDRNRNRTWDSGEHAVGGVTFQLVRQWSEYGDQSTGVVATTTTDANGHFVFRLDGQGPGGYVVHELTPPGWISTTGTDQSVTVPDGIGNADRGPLWFGNRPENPPVAHAGPDQQLDATSDAGAAVTLDGGGSSDPDGDPLTYSWSWDSHTASGARSTVTMPVGTHTVTLTVSDGIETGSDTMTVTVYPRITAHPLALHGTEGAEMSGAVATFTDPDPAGDADEYAATVDWGDKTTPSPGSIVKGPDGTFTVSAAHTYAEEGSHPAKVTVTDTDNAYNTATVADTVTVADAPLTAGSPVTVAPTEGKSTEQVVVASFTDADPAGTASDYTARISWGDGTPDTAGTVSRNGDGTFAVSGEHTYAEEGTYPTRVAIADEGGATATATGSAVVADAALHATGVDALSTNPVDLTVATFTDDNPGGDLSDFTATIDWGDGSEPTAGTITGVAGGTFSVAGSHRYATLGPKTLTIHVVDDGGAEATVPSHLLVYALPDRGGFVVGDLDAAVGGHVTFWGSRWAAENHLSGGDAPAAFKGFASGAAGTDLSSWTADPGTSGHPPATVPTYMAVLVTSHVTRAGATLSGDAPHVVIVATDPGYAGNAGHDGTGTVVAVLR